MPDLMADHTGDENEPSTEAFWADWSGSAGPAAGRAVA